MKILGIDPGYERLGVAIIEKDTQSGQKETLLYSDCIQTSPKLPFSERLFSIGQELEQLCTKYTPEVLSIEKLYFTNNQKTAMQVAQVIGLIIYIARLHGMSVHEYTPLQIKSACTGNGRADKKQMIAMLPLLIKIEKKIQYDDEYDALGVALTHSACIH
jgi:crossover junction endodeoxyribonuclease RuvC